jgi:hypothetical protein
MGENFLLSIVNLGELISIIRENDSNLFLILELIILYIQKQFRIDQTNLTDVNMNGSSVF